jgi:hypothetical protein
MHQVPRSESYGYQTRLLSSADDDSDDYNTYLKKISPRTDTVRKLVDHLGLSYNGWEAKPWPFADEDHRMAWIITVISSTFGVPPMAHSSYSTWTRIHARSTISRRIPLIAKRWKGGEPRSSNDLPTGPRVSRTVNT